MAKSADGKKSLKTTKSEKKKRKSPNRLGQTVSHVTDPRASPSVKTNISQQTKQASVGQTVNAKSSSLKTKPKSNSITPQQAPSLGSRKSLDKEQSKALKPTSALSLGLDRTKPESVSSVRSQYNLNTGKITANSLSSSMVALVAAGEHINQYSEDGLYDAVMIYLHCPTHQTVALSMVDSKGLFLPYRPIKSSESWLFAAVNLIHKVLALDMTSAKTNQKPLFGTPTVIDLTRMQLPICFEFILRVGYRVTLTDYGCKSVCSAKDNPMIAWYAEKNLKSKIKSETDPLFGPEPVVMSTLHDKSVSQPREITMIDLLRKFSGSDSPESKLVHGAGYTDEDISTIYSDFIQHTYPSEFMTFYSFEKYISKAKLSFVAKEGKLKSVFRAFSLQNDLGYIKFEEFLYGLAMIDQLSAKTNESPAKSSSKKTTNSASQTSKFTKLEAEYIFRLNAKTSPSHLTKGEFKKAMSKCQVADPEATNAEQKYVHNDKIDQASFVTFLQGQHSHSISRSSSGSRSKSKGSNETCHPDSSPTTGTSPLAMLRNNQVYGEIDLKKIDRNRHRHLVYTLSIHRITLSHTLLITNPLLNEPSPAKAMSKAKRVQSENFFNTQHRCNQMLNIVRKFAQKCKIYHREKKFSDSIPEWDIDEERLKLVDTICKICKDARTLFEASPRVVHLSSPCVVMGDIHGNLHDLLIFEQAFWKQSPYLSSSNFLFLGDYVDRGDYSIECVLYLFSMKILAPDRVFLLRGNHECRFMHKEYTFADECDEKFDKEASRVLEEVNKAFEALPLVAIMDNSIYCAHGGIPSMATKLRQIERIKTRLAEPDETCPLASEILWNDPITDREYDDMVKNSHQARKDAQNMAKGFLQNLKRNTGAYYSEEALRRFLKANSLTQVIRAHEVIPQGFRYHMSGQCLTIFSCSKYCEENNEAAVALVNDNKIRVIKVDTDDREHD